MIKIVLSGHAKYRLLERNVDVHEAKKVAKYGKIISENKGKIKKEGIYDKNKKIIVVCKNLSENVILLITVYYGN